MTQKTTSALRTWAVSLGLILGCSLSCALFLRAAAFSEDALTLNAVLLFTALPALAIPLVVRAGSSWRAGLSDLRRAALAIISLLLGALIGLGWQPHFFLWLISLSAGWFGVARIMLAFGIGVSTRIVLCAGMATLLCSTMFWGNGLITSSDAEGAAYFTRQLIAINPWISAADAFAERDLLMSPFLYLEVNSGLNNSPHVIQSSVLIDQATCCWLIFIAACGVSLIPIKQPRESLEQEDGSIPDATSSAA